MKCAVKKCNNYDIEVNYYGRSICFKHWNDHCNPEKRINLKKEFDIKEESNNLKTITSMEGIV